MCALYESGDPGETPVRKPQQSAEQVFTVKREFLHQRMYSLDKVPLTAPWHTADLYKWKISIPLPSLCALSKSYHQ